MSPRFLSLALLVPLAACGINSVPTAEEEAKARWADVQNYYQRRKLRGSRASRKPSPSKLKASTVMIITKAGGHISQGCSTRIDALVASDSIFPQEGSGCWMPSPIKLSTDSATIKLGTANVAEIITYVAVCGKTWRMIM